jgi:hypothetical protein
LDPGFPLGPILPLLPFEPFSQIISHLGDEEEEEHLLLFLGLDSGLEKESSEFFLLLFLKDISFLIN